MGNDLEFALQVLVLGFTVVMVTLISLFFLLILFNRIFYRPIKTDSKKEEPASAPPAAVEPEMDTAGNQRAIAAALGAIYAYMQESKTGFSSGSLSISVQAPGGGSVNSWVINGRRKLHDGRFELEQIRRKKRRENI